MIAKKSPLIFRTFLLLQLEYALTPKPPESKSKKKESGSLEGYPIDIDFSIKKGSDSEDIIFVKVGVNKSSNTLPGYVLFAEGVGVFEFDITSQLDHQQKTALLHFSGLSICINSLRSILANATSNSPMEKYVLPSIDVNQLLNDKSTLQKGNNKNTRIKNPATRLEKANKSNRLKINKKD